VWSNEGERKKLLRMLEPFGSVIVKAAKDLEEDKEADEVTAKRDDAEVKEELWNSYLWEAIQGQLPEGIVHLEGAPQGEVDG
jgi:hypothetical protein